MSQEENPFELSGLLLYSSFIFGNFANHLLVALAAVNSISSAQPHKTAKRLC
jgi:hypothetical protein